jgi:hypothetical protein
MFDHKDIQIFVGILLCAALLLLFSLLFWAIAAIRKRVDALTAESPAPKPEKPKPVRVAIQTRTGTRMDYGTNVKYPSNGQLIISNGESLSSIFAAGHWLSIMCVAEAPANAKKEEPAAFKIPGYWTTNSPRLIAADVQSGLVYVTAYDSPDGLMYAESPDLVNWTKKLAKEMSLTPNPPNQV